MRRARTRALALSPALSLALTLIAPARAEVPCAPPVLLPGYAHNDYLGPRPLAEALERGYRGVEADIFFIAGQLRLGHDRPDADEARNLEAVYLAPLAERLRRCGRVQPDSLPFLLLVENKAPTPEGREALAALLDRHGELAGTAGTVAGARPVEVVLVADADTPGALPASLEGRVGLQWRVTRQAPAPPPEEAWRYRLLSLNWRQEFDWDGSGRPPAAARKVLATLRLAKALSPGCRLRVHNAPARTALYRFLLEEGVDLVGVTDLRKGSEVLVGLAR